MARCLFTYIVHHHAWSISTISIVTTSQISLSSCNGKSMAPASVIVPCKTRDGIFKLLKSPGIDSKKSIPPAYVAWRVGKITLFLLGSQPPQIV